MNDSLAKIGQPAIVSTIIPAFNADRTIADTINSALAQQYESHEIVVINDGSTDSTANILESFGTKIRTINRNNGGVAVARNAGVVHSTGKYLAFLDSDDLWLPGKLAIMIGALERNPGASLAFSEYGLIDKNGREYQESSLGDDPSIRELLKERRPELLKERPFPLHSFRPFIYPSTWVVPRTVIEHTGGFYEAFKLGYEDSWMLLLLRELGEFVYVPDRLTLYRLPEHVEIIDKYFSGLSTFVKLVKKRYGHKGKALIRSVKNSDCRALLSAIAEQIDRGDRLGAMSSLVSIAKVHPAYLLRSEFIGRLLLSQNLRRLRRLARR